MKSLVNKMASGFFVASSFLMVSFSLIGQDNNADPDIYQEMMVDFEVKHVRCHGDQTGSASAWATGGQQPYTFSWSNGVLSSYAPELEAGSYFLTVTDATGFAITVNVDVLQNDSITAFVDVVHASGSQTADGEIYVNVVGGAIEEGSNNFEFTWSNGATTLNQTGLNPGYYYLNITDMLGCSHSEKIKVMGSNVEIEEIYTLTPTVNEGSGIIIFPNPSLGDITLEYNPEKISMIQIVALNGSKNLVFPAESYGRMHMQDLPKGEYVVKFYNGTQLMSTERLSVV
jgi:hypothetical protein